MASSYQVPVQVKCSFQKPSISPNFDVFKATHISSSFKFKPFLRELKQLAFQVDVSKAVKNTTIKLLDAFVDSAFEFVDIPLLQSQSNFAPVDELREAALVSNIQGQIPSDFPEGVYIRNGPNPLFGGLKSTKSVFGRSSPMWVEGEGMLHALYFSKAINGVWTVIYNNRHVETETFKLEKQRNKPSFLPAVQGDSLAVLASYMLNLLRFGKPYKNSCNTSVFEHSGKLYSSVENDLPQEIDIFTLEALGDWDVNGEWNRPFTAHPKRAPGTGELVTMGMTVIKPFIEVGVISADGKKLVHRTDLKLDRCPLCHEIGVTMRYNVFMDCPLTADIDRLLHGGQLLKYEREGNARIGIMPRYGNSDSIQWFQVKPNCTFHLINCFEEGDEVIVWGSRALESVIPVPGLGSEKFEWFPAKFRPGEPIEESDMNAISEEELMFNRPYEWRLNMRTGDVKERNLTGPNEFPMEFPFINQAFTGLKNKYGYTQVSHCGSSSDAGMGRFRGLAKLYFEEQNPGMSLVRKQVEGLIKVEYHMFEENTYCSGAAFVPKEGGFEEDDGWIITFVHHEDTDISQYFKPHNQAIELVEKIQMIPIMATAAPFMAFKVHCSSAQKPSIWDNQVPHHFKPFLRKLQQLPPLGMDISKAIKNTSVKLVDAFVDSTFEFIDQPLPPSQSNFAPVDELKDAVVITSMEGEIPDGFPEGVYLRNGPNPLFGGLKSTKSIFGRSRPIWVEGEGMIHALYVVKGGDGKWKLCYNNRYVETETYKLEKRLNKRTFLPAVEGDSSAIVSAYLLNLLRFGQVNKFLSNTNVIEHSGRVYSISETDLPQEIDMLTLKTLGVWDFNGAWNRPFTSHPKKAPGTGELVIMGINPTKPYVEVGVISADGKKLVHRVDLKLNRCILSHELSVTQRYNIFMDYALTINIGRLVGGGQILKYDKQGCARIGVMPRYGDADSIKWFGVKPNCTFHIINSFEDGDEIVVRGCRALESVIPGPDQGVDRFEWFSRKFRHLDQSTHEDEVIFPRPYEWRLNMKTGHVKERNLTGTQFTMDFPMINEAFTGLKNKYGYAQVRDCIASSNSGMAKYGGLAKLSFEEPNTSISMRQQEEGLIKEEYHMLEENTFCTGATFVPKQGGSEEDDGWIITFVHNEDTNTSQVLIIDAGKNFSGVPIAKITLPCRVPYGFHGAYIPLKL
ncbi:Carotenoid oxygenase [Corchorus capsularis]|uniref:Carotenoid oxygenase n=1 Tax=Corchorus capsularis TaxID=210143 RepID=A0A1R3GV87_COCAP|nr:Carotenoid oxygenase [Corchorus capsularis]